MSNKRTFQKIYVLVAFLVASFIRKLGEETGGGSMVNIKLLK